MGEILPSGLNRRTEQHAFRFKPLDFNDFHSADKNQKLELCRDLVANLRQHGFARLINHANPHRGFSPVGLESVSSASHHGSSAPLPLLKDMKESYDIGFEEDPLFKNIWPPLAVHDTFKPTFTSFFNACYRVELTILEAISIGLRLLPDTLGQLHAAKTNELRLTHYPAVLRSDFAHATRIAAHTDFGTITLLFQDRVGGLQMELPPGSGNFVDIESGGPHECILNVGDCLQQWTGLHSARHRVHLPGWMNDRVGETVDERFSIAYFVKPDRSASLRPLLGDIVPGKQYMTAGEFQDVRIRGTY
ncbi:hypothetical protein BBP40_001324 [Aspergillus hancockii]|nr:hypothetical protein BBP40_001324 [Aspergillus hancockii]